MGSVPFFARRWISGTTMPEALERVKALNARRVSATLDLLGENITSEAQARACTSEYIRMLESISGGSIDSHVSLKLTMLGLDIDEELCFSLLSEVLRKADALGNRVALDMEGSPYTERTLRIYEAAAKSFRSPEIVLQAYLKRTEADVERVMRANGRFRLCKGAYKESADVAFKDMPSIQAQYLKLAKRALSNSAAGAHVCLATHDDTLIDALKAFIAENKIPKERYEFQMLYGMREKTWYRLAEEGHPITVYIPYGREWQAYYARRLAERKENIFFVLKNLFRD
ncbi:MAG: proline dehydrogenase family protein [Silvanigrellales bacterium]|nr:proline dehydrogenase family protein [Silvanigrellales bacterium]